MRTSPLISNRRCQHNFPSWSNGIRATAAQFRSPLGVRNKTNARRCRTVFGAIHRAVCPRRHMHHGPGLDHVGRMLQRLPGSCRRTAAGIIPCWRNVQVLSADDEGCRLLSRRVTLDRGLSCQPTIKQIASTALRVFVARGKSCMSFLTRLGKSLLGAHRASRGQDDEHCNLAILDDGRCCREAYN